MDIILKIIKGLTLKMWYVRKRIFVYKPVNFVISKSADINVVNRLTINQPWKPTFSNKTGRFDIGENAKLQINDVIIRSGCNFVIKTGSFFQ